MKHIYKLGGDRKSSCGESYSIKCVNSDAKLDGWFESLEQAKASKPKESKQKASYLPLETSSEEAEVRQQIKDLGGKPSGRASLKTLKKQLAKLQA